MKAKYESSMVVIAKLSTEVNKLIVACKYIENILEISDEKDLKEEIISLST